MLCMSGCINVTLMTVVLTGVVQAGVVRTGGVLKVVQADCG